MRQSAFVLLCFASVSIFAQTPLPETPAASLEDAANKRIDLAQKELDRTKELVEIGALARVKLVEAEQKLADAQDDAVLGRTLYSNVDVKNWSDQVAEEGVAAAERRVQREQDRIEQARKFVDQGFIALTAIDPLQQELTTRQIRLNLARSLAQQMKTQASLAKLEESIAASQEAARNGSHDLDLVTDGMEHFEGNGQFAEGRDLKPIAIGLRSGVRPSSFPSAPTARPTCIARWGFDHRGRVDVAVNSEYSRRNLVASIS